MYHFICSNLDCSFTKKAPVESGREKFCPECGYDLIWKCQACDKPLRNEGAKFCSLCKGEIKKQRNNH